MYETLRLWPGVPKNARYATEDDILPAIPELGYEPVRILKGDYVVWSDFLMMKRADVGLLISFSTIRLFCVRCGGKTQLCSIQLGI